MKPQLAFSYWIVLLLTLAHCTIEGRSPTSPPMVTSVPILSPTPSHGAPTLPPTQPAAPTLLPSPTATSTTTPTLPPTPTFLPPLDPEQAQTTLQALLQESVDCLAPCFWGITPGQTTLADARQLLAHLRLPLNYTNTLEGIAYFQARYNFENGLSIGPLLGVQEGVVKHLTVYLTPELQQPGLPRAWRAYSPETLIARYGTPSKLDFFLGRREPPRYSMQMYFESVDLIIQYASFDVIFDSGFVRVCPLINQYDSIRIWLGKEPWHPPGEMVPLEEAVALTLADFANLLTGSPENACMNLNPEMFP